MEKELEGLVELIKKKKPYALEKVMDLYINSVYGIAKSILIEAASEEDIEECVQDVFIDAWNNIDRFDAERGSFKTWLLILCKYKALNLKKALTRKNNVIDLEEIQLKDKEDIEEGYLFKEKKQEILKAISAFNDVDRELFLRRYFLDQSIDYICTCMKLSRQAADNRLWRGRKKLRELLNYKEGKSINE